jgi:hypothetical protein
MGLLDSLASSLDVDVDEEDLDDSPFGFDIVEEGPDGDAPDPSDAPDAPDAPDVVEPDAERDGADPPAVAASEPGADEDAPARAAASTAGGRGPPKLHNDRSEGDWVEADLPTGETMYGVVQTVRGPVAVGTDGLVLGRGPAGWERLVERGPAARSNSLYDVDVTGDGERVWFAGSSGALGMYDVVDRRKYDFSAPMEKTSTWESVAVDGHGEDTRLLVANGSGEVVGAVFDEAGRPRFGEPTEPGSGSTLAAVDIAAGVGYAADTSGGVYRLRTDEWERIGVDGAAVDFRDVLGTAIEDDPDGDRDRQDGEGAVPGDEGRLLVAGDGGLVYRYDPAFDRWTPIVVGTADVHALDAADRRTVAVGDQGAIHGRTDDADWRRVPSPVAAELLDVALGPLDVAVGEGGTALERTPAPAGSQGVAER